jgi:hypothetical protein
MVKDEKKTITVNETEYNLEDFTSQQSAFLNHINDLDRKLSSAQFNIDQLNVGRQKFVELLADSLENPEEAEVVN